MYTETTLKILKTYVLYGYYSGATPYFWNSINSLVESTKTNKFQVFCSYLAVLYSTLITFGSIINLIYSVTVNGGDGFELDNESAGLNLMYCGIAVFTWLAHVNHVMRRREIITEINQCILVFQDIEGK